MPDYYDAEQVIDKLIEVLKANLPAEISAINVLKSATGDMVLTNPEHYFFGTRFLDDFISVGKSVVEVVSTNIDGITLNDSLTEEETFYMIALHVWEKKSQVAERKILRYQRALRKVIDEHALLEELTPYSENIKDSVVSAVEYTLLDYKGNVYMKTVAIRLKVQDVFTY